MIRHFHLLLLNKSSLKISLQIKDIIRLQTFAVVVTGQFTGFGRLVEERAASIFREMHLRHGARRCVKMESHHPDDGESTFLRNVYLFYTVSSPDPTVSSADWYKISSSSPATLQVITIPIIQHFPRQQY
jgi:hypothetical protein